MGRLGRILGESRMERDRFVVRSIRPPEPTIAGHDRAILELWDLGWSVGAIAAELTIAAHLVEQAVALFGDTEGSIA